VQQTGLRQSQTKWGGSKSAEKQTFKSTGVRGQATKETVCWEMCPKASIVPAKKLICLPWKKAPGYCETSVTSRDFIQDNDLHSHRHQNIRFRNSKRLLLTFSSPPNHKMIDKAAFKLSSVVIYVPSHIFYYSNRKMKYILYINFIVISILVQAVSKKVTTFRYIRRRPTLIFTALQWTVFVLNSARYVYLLTPAG
jgi:hypothetical protein